MNPHGSDPAPPAAPVLSSRLVPKKMSSGMLLARFWWCLLKLLCAWWCKPSELCTALSGVQRCEAGDESAEASELLEETERREDAGELSQRARRRFCGDRGTDVVEAMVGYAQVLSSWC